MKTTKKHSYKLYIPWYTSDHDILDDEEEDSWVQYIRRNLPHSFGVESPFPDSSWSYATGDSPFDQNDKTLIPSDDEIHQEVWKALDQNGEVDASHIKVIVLNGIVSLFGGVSDIHMKKEAERIAYAIEGVWNVKNELEVIQ